MLLELCNLLQDLKIKKKKRKFSGDEKGGRGKHLNAYKYLG